ncbi:MAG: hypothetical protein R2939_10035 [Kofleriaceae bacterium]
MPLLPRGAPSGTPAHIVLKRSDEDFLFSLTHATNTPSLASTRQRVQDSFTKPIEGLVTFGLDQPSRDRDMLERQGINLVMGAAIVEHGARPTLTFALVVVLVGLASLACFAWVARSAWRARAKRLGASIAIPRAIAKRSA